MQERNWAGNYSYRAHTIHRPRRLDEVREVVSRSERVRVLGSRHSFTDIADSSTLLSLDGLPADLVVDHSAGTVSFGAALRYGELAEALQPKGLALANLASLPHISVAGAVSTATHGSGDRNGTLATAVRALELVRADGQLVSVARGERDFDGLVVGLGAVGALTRVTLDVEPAYEVRQRVFERLSWDALVGGFDEVFAAGYSVSAFTRWGEAVDQVWVKSRVRPGEPETVRSELFGAVPAVVERHPILGLDPVNCSPQLGVAGLWSERLPHFRMGFTPSAGDEIQSEYLLPRANAIAAFEEMRALGPIVEPLLAVSEIRTIARDELWMSPAYGRDTVAIHFTWRPEEIAVRAALAEVEAALLPLEARPHWGKLFLAEASVLASAYERLPDFVALLGRFDPRGVFVNEWLRRHVAPGLGSS